jgi:hypothetical protein
VSVAQEGVGTEDEPSAAATKWVTIEDGPVGASIGGSRSFPRSAATWTSPWWKSVPLMHSDSGE